MSRFVAFLLFIELRTFQTRALCFQDRNPCSKSQLLSKSESRPDRALVLGGQFHNGVLFANSPLSCTLWLPSQVVQVANHFSVELLTFFSFTRSSAKNSAGVTSYVASCCCDLPAWLFVKSKLIAELLPNSYRFAKLWNCMQRPIWLKACNTECVRVLLLFILFWNCGGVEKKYFWATASRTPPKRKTSELLRTLPKRLPNSSRVFWPYEVKKIRPTSNLVGVKSCLDCFALSSHVDSLQLWSVSKNRKIFVSHIFQGAFSGRAPCCARQVVRQRIEDRVWLQRGLPAIFHELSAWHRMYPGLCCAAALSLFQAVACVTLVDQFWELTSAGKKFCIKNQDFLPKTCLDFQEIVMCQHPKLRSFFERIYCIFLNSILGRGSFISWDFDPLGMFFWHL